MTNAPRRRAVALLHAARLEISPALGRRLRIRSATTSADLDHFRQIACGWSDRHLDRCVIDRNA